MRENAEFYFPSRHYKGKEMPQIIEWAALYLPVLCAVKPAAPTGWFYGADWTLGPSEAQPCICPAQAQKPVLAGDSWSRWMSKGRGSDLSVQTGRPPGPGVPFICMERS